jgi:hypothetical protein
MPRWGTGEAGSSSAARAKRPGGFVVVEAVEEGEALVKEPLGEAGGGGDGVGVGAETGEEGGGFSVGSFGGGLLLVLGRGDGGEEEQGQEEARGDCPAADGGGMMGADCRGGAWITPF